MNNAMGKSKKFIGPIFMYKGTGKKYYRGCRTWLAGFLNINFHRLPTRSFNKRLKDFLEMFYGPGYPSDFIVDDSPENRKALEIVQRKIIIWLVQFSNAGQRSAQSKKPEYGFASYLVHTRVNIQGENIFVEPDNTLLQLDSNRKVNKAEKNKNLFELLHMSENEEDINLGEPVSKSPFLISSVYYRNYCDNQIDKTLLRNLVPLISASHINVIRCCPECSLYFKSSKRKQSDFCKKHQNKKSVYKWREENPEEYQWYQYYLMEGKKRTIAEIRKKHKIKKGEGK